MNQEQEKEDELRISGKIALRTEKTIFRILIFRTFYLISIFSFLLFSI